MIKKIVITFSIICSFQLTAQTIPNKFIDFYEEIQMVEFGKKLEMLDAVIKKNPNEPWYYWMKASVYDLMNDDDKTLENYNKALVLNPEFSGAHASLARFLYNNDSTQLELALNHINKAIQLEPEDEFYHIDRGEIYLAMKKYDEAMKEADYALTLKDFDIMAAERFKIEVLHAQGKKEELKQFVKQHDLSMEGEFLGTKFALMLASVYEEMGENEKACMLYRGAAEPYLVMEEQIPEFISDKLGKCK